MFIAGIVVAIVGTVGVFAAVGMEIKTHEPIWLIAMKIFPWLVGIGLFLIGLSYMGG